MMDNTTIFWNIAGAIIQVVGVVVSIFAIIYSSQRFERTQKARQQLMTWYKDTVSLMIETIHLIENGKTRRIADYDTKRDQLLWRLSAQIEIGRCHYPNKKDENDQEIKPRGHRSGHRDKALEYIYQFYKEVSEHNSRADTAELWKWERLYSERVLYRIDPAEMNKYLKKYTELNIDDGKTVRDD